MKTLAFAFFLNLMCILAIAQDDNYKGPAANSVAKFWDYSKTISDLLDQGKWGSEITSKMTPFERSLKEAKTKDPSYDISQMEKEFKKIKDRIQGDKDKGNEENDYYSGIWQKLVGVYSSGSDIEPGVSGKKYYDRAKELNLAEYNEKKKTAGVASLKGYVAKIDGMLTDYDQYLIRADRLKWNVIQPMTESRGASNPQMKMNMLQHAKFECEGVLMLSPNNEPFKKKLEEIKKLMGNADNEASKFFTSDFHKTNLNKIVWSSKPLVIGKENEMSQFIKNEFKTGDYIFGTVYLGVNVSDVMNGNTNLRVRIKVDDGTAIWGGDLSYFELPLTTQGKSYFQFALLPDAQWMKENYAPYIAEENWTYSYFLDELVRAGDVSHEITCEFMFPTNKVRDVKNKLSLDLNNGITEIKSMSVKLHDELMASRTLPKPV